jgi:hypothetical protein
MEKLTCKCGHYEFWTVTVDVVWVSFRCGKCGRVFSVRPAERADVAVERVQEMARL